MAEAELEYDEQSYYPSAKCRLTIRFEEGALKAEVKKKTSTKVTTTLKGVKDDEGAPLDAVSDSSSPTGVKRYVLQRGANVSGGGPQKQDSSADKFTHLIGAIVPKTATWNQNGARTSDQLTLEIPFRDLPFDPRVIRSCAVEYYLGTVTADDFAAGQQGITRADVNGNDTANGAEPLHVCPDSYVDPNGTQRTNLRFEGWVDEWSNDWPEDGEPMISLECRDNLTLLIDQIAPPKLVIAAKDPIDKAVATYLSNFPQCEGLTVEYRPSDEEPPTLDASLAKTAFKPELGPSPAKGGASGELKAWDYITDVCGALGLICRLEGTNLIIQRARTLTSSNTDQRSDDPFKPRNLPSGTADKRRMIYGRNINQMIVKRKYGKGSPQNVEVRCYMPRRKKTLVARYPTESDKKVVGSAKPGDGRNDQKWLVWRVAGIENEDTLKNIAQTIYESVGRNEITVSISTKNLASFGGSNTDPDILDMRAGDSIDVFVNRDLENDEFSTITTIEQILLIQNKAKEFLMNAGYGADIAQAYADAYSQNGFQTTLRVKNSRYDWSTDTGVKISIDAINYVEIRLDQPDSAT
jgi:hypothetical protein